jgi:hypothetical protein
VGAARIRSLIFPLMILYNVTTSIEPRIAEEWVAYMRDHHMDEVVGTGCFIRSQLLRLLNEEDDGITYAAQYFAVSLEQLEAYQEHFAPALREEMDQKFKGNYVSFRTVLEVVE